MLFLLVNFQGAIQKLVRGNEIELAFVLAQIMKVSVVQEKREMSDGEKRGERGG